MVKDQALNVYGVIRYHPLSFRKGLIKPRETLGAILGVASEIRMGRLPSTSHKCYDFSWLARYTLKRTVCLLIWYVIFFYR